MKNIKTSKPRIGYIIAICLSTLALNASAIVPDKDFVFSQLSISDGLSQSTVLSSCQDELGHMWFATHNGLNKYDGYDFTVYRHESKDSTSILDNIIKTLYVDSRGGLWVGTEKGLSYYDREKDLFRNLPTDEKAVTGIAEDKDGRFIIATGGNLRFFDSMAWKWEMSNPHQPETFRATILYKDKENIWIGTASDGLFCYFVDTRDIKRISAFKSEKPIQCLLKHNEKIWIATEGDGLHSICLTSGDIKTYHHQGNNPKSISSNYVRTLECDNDGNLWVGTFNGLSILSGDEFINVKSDPFKDGSLSQSSVRCIRRDNQGGMWLGTYFGGVNYWHPSRNRFTHIKMEYGSNSLNDNVVSCITEDINGALWIGTNSGGVNHYDPVRDRFTYYKLESSAHSSHLESNDIKAIYVDEESGSVFVGAHAGGLNIIDKKRKVIRHAEGSDLLDIYAIIPGGKHRLMLGTLDGLKEFDIRTGKIVSIDEDINGYPLRKLKIKALLKDSQERIWIGGENGLATYISTDGQFTKCVLHSPDSPLHSVFVQSIYESSTKLIWIATRTGLWCYDDREKGITQYTVEDGLASDIIHGIEEDSFGRLWISTDHGLSCFNPFSGTFRNFSISDGLQSNQFNSGSHCRKSNGDIMFGGINGISSFNPSDIEDNPYTPQPIITSLEIFNKEIRPSDKSGILEKSIMETSEIVLKHDQSSFTLEFSVPNYLAGQNNSFAYKLQGYDREWYDIRNSRSVSYSNLPHGNYTFMVKAANNDGVWNNNPTTLQIRIKPIWYKTTIAILLFIVMVILFFIALFGFIVERKERENRLELEKQEKVHQEEIHQMKMKFFINISHEMRTPLTLIINPLSEMIGKSSDSWMRMQLKYVERNAQRLLHLVNQLMDYRRAELGVFKLSIRPENVHKIIKENCSYYEKLAQSKKIKYSLISDLEGKTLYTDGQYLEIILNNLLSNAFKYTESGEITVHATQQDNNLKLEVADTGTGIPTEKQTRIFERFYQIDNEHIGSGIGLSLVNRLVELHHGQIRLQSEEGKGSTFTILLPIQLSAYSADELGNSNNDEIHTGNTPYIYIADAATAEEYTPEIDNKKRGRILIAEDNEDIRNYIKNDLRSMFDIMLAKNGAEALQMLKEQEPDIVITDMMMPVMDGLKLCTHIKQNINTSHIPIIMISAKTDSKDQLEALKAGADDYIAKPFSMAILVTKIHNMLRTYHRLQDKATKSMEIAPEKISFNILDEQFLNKAISLVERNIDNTDFSTEEFAREMNMSRSNLHIKLKALTGESALDFIRKIRFKEACRLLKDGRYSISEISDMVGFNTPSYFATCFKKYIGCLPTEYIKNLNKEHII